MWKKCKQKNEITFNKLYMLVSSSGKFVGKFVYTGEKICNKSV